VDGLAGVALLLHHEEAAEESNREEEDGEDDSTHGEVRFKHSSLTSRAVAMRPSEGHSPNPDGRPLPLLGLLSIVWWWLLKAWLLRLRHG